MCEPVSNTTAASASAPHNQSICSITDNIFFTMSGFDAAQMNYVSIIASHEVNIVTVTMQTLLPVILEHTPAGTSVKTVAQFAQVRNIIRIHYN